MRLGYRWKTPSARLLAALIKCRRLLPRQRSQAFGPAMEATGGRIGRIYVINLDRQPGRWDEMKRELSRILDGSGADLLESTERFPAVDAARFVQEPPPDAEVDPIYTLRDQLFVEPQPLASPAKFELDSPIRMSRPEVAVALSHVNVWKRIAAGDHEYSLVLEDDVLFRRQFTTTVDRAWGQIEVQGGGTPNFDILYLSYQEVKHGAPKTLLSKDVFCPVRGLWQLSGYVVSREGAERLLRLLPCRGPVDLWLNHQFAHLEVRATRRSVIMQRPDLTSTNSYSILPSLTKIGAINGESAAMFHLRPTHRPVFAFGPKDSGLSSLAMALSMLGYRCCSDLATIPTCERDALLAGRPDRVFDAYVNIGCLEGQIDTLRKRYPHARYIITTNAPIQTNDMACGVVDQYQGTEVTILPLGASNKWQIVCEHLTCPPPTCSFPEMADLGQRTLANSLDVSEAILECRTLKRDTSPWVVPRDITWRGIQATNGNSRPETATCAVKTVDNLDFLDLGRWLAREDTFGGNRALFRPTNIQCRRGIGAQLSIKKEALGVREYSAAALSSRHPYLFGRFETVLRASNVPGVLTGFFLHRNSPRQEIDVEITGCRPTRMLTNVFYNPGSDGASFDYGYRGAASEVELGFDASEGFHRYAIEWGPCEIRWYVDDHLVHRRVEWDPTPIPHLPMILHVNIWPSSSTELAGRLIDGKLPATAHVKSIELEANISSTASET